MRFKIRVNRNKSVECVGCGIDQLLTVNDKGICVSCFHKTFGLTWDQAAFGGMFNISTDYDTDRMVELSFASKAPKQIMDKLRPAPEWKEPELPRVTPTQECSSCGFQVGSCLCSEARA